MLVERTLPFSVTLRTPLAVLSAPACLADSLTAKPPTAGSLAVTLPLWAFTICFALASEIEVLNWTIAVTDLFGDFFAAVASFAAADGAALADVAAVSGTATASR